MPSVLSDKKWRLDDNKSDNDAHRKFKKQTKTKREKKKKKKNVPAPIVPKCLIFLVKGKAT